MTKSKFLFIKSAIYILLGALFLLSQPYLSRSFFAQPQLMNPLASGKVLQGVSDWRPFYLLDWIQVADQVSIGLGDYLRTGSNSTMEVTFDEGHQQISLMQNTLVRFVGTQGSPRIEIRHGNIKRSNPESSRIQIDDLRTDQNIISSADEKGLAAATKKGQTENSPADQKSVTSSDSTLPKSQEESKDQIFSKKLVADASPKEEFENKPASEKAKVQPLSYEKVYPPIKSVLLHKGQTRALRFTLGETCRRSCEVLFYHQNRFLTVLRGDQNKNYFILSLSELPEGKIDWRFKEDSHVFEGHFYYFKYSNSKLKEWIQKNLPIEILN